MSMPAVPTSTITRDDALNIILSSIGMEELGMAHMINAEAEKIQHSLGTLHADSTPATMAEIAEVNASANQILRDVIKSQMLLTMQLEDAIALATAINAVEEPATEETKEETDEPATEATTDETTTA
ncbi:MAG: hypothetical protein ATN34_04105 [Epulopiscium sp. Nele67-Bin002]|nr:MAG: hypothetical protein ATN34_04105 [Epulopiscium sp. Nele67-Bin002]OON93298.1 MAG: hypothetical protein ATN33_05925 [Epulopiscium sp. Nele67-Bin001]